MEKPWFVVEEALDAACLQDWPGARAEDLRSVTGLAAKSAG